ncbi:hypothetical protein [Nocardia sp. BMG51109]|uniref:hypothetical protein n=1 Tax=Nocardia sp. BMG51109 TaxID=1056816 RepID=UPI00046479F4|nr:hypothetical protein [Nocardia sp. BMG51109]
MTDFDEKIVGIGGQLEEIQTSIGNLDERSIASRLISVGVDISSLTARQESVENRLTSVERRFTSVENRLRAVESDIGALKSDVGTLKSDVAQILALLRNRG